MFHLEPVTTTNLFSVVQIIVMILGFYFAYNSLQATQTSVALAAQNLQVASQNLQTAANSLNLNTANAQAQLYNQMLMQGRDLQLAQLELKYAKEPDTAAKQIDLFGIVIAYYAACFELRKVLTLPPIVDRLMSADLKEAMRKVEFKKKWETIKGLYSKEFLQYVSSLEGV